MRSLGDALDLQISIDALDSEVLEAVVGVDGYGEKIRKTLRDVADAGIPLRTNSVLMPCNIGYAGSACGTCPTFQKCMGGAGRCIRDVMKTYGFKNDDYPDPRCPSAPAGVRIS